MRQKSEKRFGGDWTKEKLAILQKYLDAYTTVFKKQTYFNIIYIDAFAGTGQIRPLKEYNDFDAQFISGSAEIALEIKDRHFDELIFIEKNTVRCTQLHSLRNNHSQRDIDIRNEDANDALRKLFKDWNKWRGVLFLDPFSTEVGWATIEKIAGFNALDTWLLFPTSAIARMLPISKTPDDIDPKWASLLTTVFGNQNWKNLYKESPQVSLFGAPEIERIPGTEGLVRIYKNNLKQLFGKRFLETSRTLRNSKNSPLFEFIFCVGHPNGINAAKNIAHHILNNM